MAASIALTFESGQAAPEGQTLSLEKRGGGTECTSTLVPHFVSLVMLNPPSVALYCHLCSEVGLLHNECDLCFSGMSSEEVRARAYALMTMSTCVIRRAC